MDLVFVLQIQLWRADLVTSILELGHNGQILNTREMPLYPPGLVFGVPSNSMRGMHISKYLPMLSGTSMHALFVVNGLGGETAPVVQNGMVEDVAGKRSNLKGVAASLAAKAERVGPIHYLKVRHHSDDADLNLTVQVCREFA